MTEADLHRIESELGIHLPETYRTFLTEQSAAIDELEKALDYVVTPWTDADEIITANRERANDRLLIATNGAGDFWFVRLDGNDAGVFMHEHETDEIERVHECPSAWLDYLRRRLERQNTETVAAKEKAEREFAELTFGPTGISSMFEAAQDMESIDRLAVLLAHDHDVNVVNRNKFGGTPLIAATNRGNLAAVIMLLSAGADPCLKDSNDNTCLHQCNNAEIARLLLENGADPNAVNSVGMTPLHSCAFFGRERVIEQLLEAGADKTRTNSDGLTPLEVAEKRGKEPVFELLK